VTVLPGSVHIPFITLRSKRREWRWLSLQLRSLFQMRAPCGGLMIPGDARFTATGHYAAFVSSARSSKRPPSVIKFQTGNASRRMWFSTGSITPTIGWRTP
jgi:hypothetical protein